MMPWQDYLDKFEGEISEHVDTRFNLMLEYDSARLLWSCQLNSLPNVEIPFARMARSVEKERMKL